MYFPVSLKTCLSVAARESYKVKYIKPFMFTVTSFVSNSMARSLMYKLI